MERPLELDLAQLFILWNIPPVPGGERWWTVSRWTHREETSGWQGKREQCQESCWGSHFPLLQRSNCGRTVSGKRLLLHSSSCSSWRFQLDFGTNTDCIHQSVHGLSVQVMYRHTCQQYLNVYVLFFTGPPPPQNITVGSVTADQILVHWTIPDTPLNFGWRFLVRYVDVSTEQERIAGMTNISKISETSLLQSYMAVIGGLASHRKYRIDVSTVTQHGIESSEQAAVTVQTGKHATFCSVKKITMLSKSFTFSSF